MSDETALLGAIWEYPHDDTPRLVYADWLQENGREPYAEFIRVQCALAARPDDSPGRDKLVRRERHLWGTFGKEFRRWLPDRLRASSFRRGFVAPALVRVSGHKFAKVYRELLPHAPLWDIEPYALLEGQLDALLNDERFLRVGGVTVNGGSAFGRMLASPYVRNLSRLNWGYSHAGVGNTKILCDSAVLPHLTRLSLQGAKLGDEGAAVIAESPLAGRLTELNLASNEIGAEGAGELAKAGRFERLTRLDLSYNGHGRETGRGDPVVAALTAGGGLPVLRHLSLHGTGLTVASAEAIAAWPGAASLRHLEMQDVTLRAAGIRAMARSPYLRNLETIDLFPWRAEREEYVAILTEWLGRAEASSTYILRGTRTKRA